VENLTLIGKGELVNRFHNWSNTCFV